MSNKSALLVFQGQLNRELIDLLVSQGWSAKHVVDIKQWLNQSHNADIGRNPSRIESNLKQLDQFLSTPVLVVIPNIKSSNQTTTPSFESAYLSPPQNTETDIFQVGHLRIDFQARQVTINGQEIQPSVTMFRLLAYLACKCGQVVSYEELLTSVWHYSPRTGDRKVITNCVRRLRKKLGESAEGATNIITVPGIGYRLCNQQQWERLSAECK